MNNAKNMTGNLPDPDIVVRGREFIKPNPGVRGPEFPGGDHRDFRVADIRAIGRLPAEKGRWGGTWMVRLYDGTKLAVQPSKAHKDVRNWMRRRGPKHVNSYGHETTNPGTGWVELSEAEARALDPERFRVDYCDPSENADWGSRDVSCDEDFRRTF